MNCAICGKPLHGRQRKTCGAAACKAQRNRQVTAARQGALRANKRALRVLGAMPPTEHGIAGYTSWGCRCEACRAARLWYDRARAQRRGAA
jgi:hypothetical protein